MENNIPIAIRLNGEDVQEKPGTLAELVAGKGLSAASLVIEHNGRIIPHQHWPEIELSPGDVLELLNFVGGG